MIAIATLLSSAVLCWGQMPTTGLRGSMAQARMARSQASAPQSAASEPSSAQPSFTPPQSVEGAWVDDSDVVAAPQMVPTPDDQGGFDPEAYAQAYGDQPCDDQGGECGPNGCGLGHPHGPFLDLWGDVHAHRRIWFSLDYLSFWAKGDQVPALVTTSPLGTPQTEAGRLPESATTSILFGGNRLDTDQRNGARINLGYWLVDGEFLGVEGGYFALQQANTQFNAASTFTEGVPPVDQILARPFTNVDPLLPSPQSDAALVAFPGMTLLNTQGQLSGAIDIRTTSNIQGANADFRRLIWIDFTSQRRLDLLLGYRFFRLDDSVTINDQSTFVPNSGVLNTLNFTSQDQFAARNIFNGGELGLKFQQYCCRFQLELIGKVAFGNNREVVNINGSNTLTTLGQTAVNVGGLLAQPSNIGQYQRDVFAILPEANVNLKYDLTRNLRATAGYSFIYMNRVQRSGSAIDTTLNPTQINGGTLNGQASPSFAWNDTTFWVHGVSAGFEYRW